MRPRLSQVLCRITIARDETTFGKALVQSVYRVSEGAEAVTTAHYYTPSGRLIAGPRTTSMDT